VSLDEAPSGAGVAALEWIGDMPMLPALENVDPARPKGGLMVGDAAMGFQPKRATVRAATDMAVTNAELSSPAFSSGFAAMAVVC